MGKAVGPIGIAGIALGGDGDFSSESALTSPVCAELSNSEAVRPEFGVPVAITACGVAVPACSSLTSMFAAVAENTGFALSDATLPATCIVAAGTVVTVTTACSPPP